MADLERDSREKLVAALSGHFYCIQECRIIHPVFQQSLRADVVAICRDELTPYAFAFEVKCPTGKWEFKNWSALIAQASFYPFCRIVDNRVASDTQTIDCAFVFPHPLRAKAAFHCGDEDSTRGAYLLAQHFRVGGASFETRTDSRLSLSLGTDIIWRSDQGFRNKADSKLASIRFGSRRVSTR